MTYSNCAFLSFWLNIEYIFIYVPVVAYCIDSRHSDISFRPTVSV